MKKLLIFKYSFLLIWLLLKTSSILAQGDISLELEYNIKASIIKNFAISGISSYQPERISDSTFLLSNTHVAPGLQGPFYHLQYPGFGYTDRELECKVTEMDNMQYPDDSWDLYKVDFLKTATNDTLVSWNSYKYFLKKAGDYLISTGSFFRLISKKNILVAVNEKKQIKFISGLTFNHAISQDFRLNRKKPETYIPFLKMKLFHRNFEEIEFVRREKNLLIFLATSKVSNQIYEYEYYLDPQIPDNFVKVVSLTPPFKYVETDSITKSNYSQPNYKIDIDFASLEDKEHYMLDALMKNIYMYRLLHLDNLYERINADTSTWILNEGKSDLDSLLPNFDEYLAEFKLLQYGCCFTNKGPWQCLDINNKARIDFPIFEPVKLANKYRLVVGSTRMYGYIEFYKFYKSKDEVLVKRPGKYATKEAGVQEDWCGVPEGYFGQGEGTRYRYDLYYHPEKREDKVNPPYPCEYLPPAPLYPRQISDVFENICPPEEPISPYDRIKQPVDHYLVALDTKTREVYFLSGKEIYLSKATTLYRFGKSPQEPEDMSKWQLPEKLTYIRDRLYRYLVDNVKEEDIVSQDDEKITLEVEGEEYGQPLRLRVHFYHATPEMLDIEKLK